MSADTPDTRTPSAEARCACGAINVAVNSDGQIVNGVWHRAYVCQGTPPAHVMARSLVEPAPLGDAMTGADTVPEPPQVVTRPDTAVRQGATP